MASGTDLSVFENDPQLFLFTSLTAGSSHIITATSRLETILKANKIHFQAIDIATDETARRLWQRRAREKKLPGLVKDGFVIGDLDEVEEWNEFGELKENIGPTPAPEDNSAGGRQGINIRPVEQGTKIALPGAESISPPTSASSPPPHVDSLKRVALPGAGEIAERNKPKATSDVLSEPSAVESMTASPQAKEESINAAKAISQHHPSLDHLSAPGSRIHSGTATPHSEPVTEPEPAPAATRQHRGSEVKDALPEEIKKLESEHALHEHPGEDDDEAIGHRVSSLRFAGDTKTQAQEAKQPDDAGKTVAD